MTEKCLIAAKCRSVLFCGDGPAGVRIPHPPLQPPIRTRATCQPFNPTREEGLVTSQRKKGPTGFTQVAQNLGLRLGIFGTRATSVVEVREVQRLLEAESPIPRLVRIGPAEDGGYFVPEDFDEIAAVFSPGVGAESGFELFFAERGIPCFLIDGSVREAPACHDLLNFEPVWLRARSDISSAGNSVTLDEWVEKHAPEGDVLLQIDIEGDEFEVLLSAPDRILQRARILVVELHGLTSVWSPSGRALIAALLARLSSSHRIVHSNPNRSCRTASAAGLQVHNCLELTFYRRDR